VNKPSRGVWAISEPVSRRTATVNPLIQTVTMDYDPYNGSTYDFANRLLGKFKGVGSL